MQIFVVLLLIVGCCLEYLEDFEDLFFFGVIYNDCKVYVILIGLDGSCYQLECELCLGVDDFVLCKKVVVVGFGVILLFEGYCDRELVDGSLVCILLQWILLKSIMQVVYLLCSSQILVICVLIDFFVEVL